MVDIIEVLITGLPLIIVALISGFGGYFIDRFKPKTTQDKVDEFKCINDAFKTLNEEYKKDSEENKRKYEESQAQLFEFREESQKQLNELKIEVGKMKQQINYLSDYKRKYKKLKFWAKDSMKIAKEQGIELPALDSEIIDDIKNVQKKRNYIEETLKRGGR